MNESPAGNEGLWQRPYLQILSDDQLAGIYQGAVDILARTGGDFHDPDTVACLGRAGARVDGPTRVRIPARMVADALQAAPSGVAIWDRNGRPAMQLEGRRVYFGCGSDTPFTLDPYTGEHRKAVLADVVRAARVTQALPELDFCMSFGMASDLPPAIADVHHAAAMLRHTTKPLILTSWDVDGLAAIVDLLVAVRGSEAALAEKPLAVVFLMAISPLRLPCESLQKLRYCAARRIPVIWTSGCPTMGMTAPVDGAGAAAVAVAEFLAGLVLAQLVQPGTPVVLGGAYGSLDMTTGVRPYASPEHDLGHIFQGEMARHLGLPSWGVGGVTDANTLDTQAAAEAHQTLFAAALGGNNLIHDLGYLESGLCSSLELLVMCAEFAGRTRRFLEGVTVSAETLATRTVDAVGPGGDYFTLDRTVGRFRDEIWVPELANRHDYSRWQAAGGTTFSERARDKVQRLLAGDPVVTLPDDVNRRIDTRVARHDARRGTDPTKPPQP